MATPGQRPFCVVKMWGQPAQEYRRRFRCRTAVQEVHGKRPSRVRQCESAVFRKSKTADCTLPRRGLLVVGKHRSKVLNVALKMQPMERPLVHRQLAHLCQ